MAPKLFGRREFIKAAAAGLGGLTILKSSSGIATAKKREGGKIIYRTLGNTGIRLPVINMGVMNSDNPNLLRAALDSGIVHLDTAHMYQGGRNEEMIGEVIKGRPRDSYVIATKIWLSKSGGNRSYSAEITGDAFTQRLNMSLKRLGLDYVDILYHHDIVSRAAALYEPILNAMERAKKDGKVRFQGISTHGNEPEVIQAAIDSKFYEVILTSYNYRQKHAAEMKASIARAAQAGIGIVAMKVMGGTVYSQKPDKINAAAALKWALENPHVHTAVPGFVTFEEMNIDLAVMEDLALSDGEKKFLQQHASLPGLYCQGCQECLGQCRQKLPIPDLMRAYMYAYGYRNQREARNVMAALDLPRRVCTDCKLCPVQCSVGFNVAGKILEVTRLRKIGTLPVFL